MEAIRPRAGLILTGGGARAAYQVGVLQALREMLPDPKVNPFPIICGTSAGAVNAGALAVHADDFGGAVGQRRVAGDAVHRQDQPVGGREGDRRLGHERRHRGHKQGRHHQRRKLDQKRDVSRQGQDPSEHLEIAFH